MLDYSDFQFRNDEDSPDYFLWQVFSDWQNGKNLLIEEYNITSPQMTILTAIYWLLQNERDTIQVAVADAAKMDKMTTSTVLRTLQKKGLVTRTEHASDTRAKTVHLTKRGLETTVKSLKRVNNFNLDYFSALGDSKMTFINLLRKLLIINSMQTEFKSTYQTTIKAPIEKVWDALINPEIVKKYFFESNQETDWKVGSPILWTGEYEGTPYTDKGVVLEFSPNKKLSYSYLSSWSGLEDKTENYLLVTYQVKPIEAGTELKITQSNYDEDKAKHSSENWAVVIDGLKKIVE
ncbi:SRPBCC domain-containing protein [Marinoscillum sp. 108]|uniref:SRPBCC domain-containing protein n=1 Tax=Marinoscillum sp. 108 TaxID=2653151 RepID=UPI0012F1F5E9|nr:SRPBCC domain-containing protein [Marinoscillum sp. 108]VXD11292.1 SRPBCC domain-containing protein (modular protein) [Marinoscillum sp. 108]